MMQLLALTVALCGFAEAADEVRRLAVVVGSNGASPGRSELVFAQTDASSMAAALTDVGAFEPEDVEVLLDPQASEVRAALERKLTVADKAKEDTLLFFYYSGHADRGALYPGGERLPLQDLRTLLEDARAAVRVGVVDACGGGGWTGTRGLTADDEPFEVQLQLVLQNEGSVLLASSAGDENAHEAEALRGGLFTHHLVSALRGAADQNDDGQVTANEAYDYARQATIRDAALFAGAAQHPSFHINLKGRQDLPLSTVASSPTRLRLSQESGPLQVVHVSSGVTVFEIPEGPRAMEVALPPGEYIVRRQSGTEVWSRTVKVVSGERLEVLEDDLVLHAISVRTRGRIEPIGPGEVIVPRGRTELQLGGVAYWAIQTRSIPPGVSFYGSGSYGFIGWIAAAHGISDRAHVVLPAILAVRFGSESAGISPWGGISEFLYIFNHPTRRSLILDTRSGVDIDRRLGSGISLDAGAQVTTVMSFSNKFGTSVSWYPIVQLGASLSPAWRVQFHPYVRVLGTDMAHIDDRSRSVGLEIGGGAVRAGRGQPLTSIWLTRHFALSTDGAFGFAVDLADGRTYGTWFINPLVLRGSF